MRKPKTTRSRNPEATRAAILKAALREFAEEGLDGARIDHIARAAGVNKALLYYYFQDKEALYAAVLESVMANLFSRLNVALDPELSPCDQVLSYAKAHFDYIASAPHYPILLQREMMRAGRKTSTPLTRIFTRYGRPFYQRFTAMVLEGIQRGDFRPVDPEQVVGSVIGVVVFYFVSAPVHRIVRRVDPLAPKQLAARRNAMLDFIAHALFAFDKDKKETTPGIPRPIRTTRVSRTKTLPKRQILL